jgi:LPS-assembly lipoprotein
MKSFVSLAVASLVTLVVTACGFHLRGEADLSFATLYLQVPSAEMKSVLSRNIQLSSHTRVVDSASNAEAILSVMSDTQDKTILSINAAGKVSEYRLTRRFAFQVQTAEGKELLPPSEITLQREITYTDALVLSKAAEETLIWKEMQDDLTQQVFRRLTSIKARPKASTPPAQP